MSFVTPKLYGRMGNQMFQIAAAMGHAYKYGLEFLIPRYTGDPGRPAEELYWTHFPEFDPNKHEVKSTHHEKTHAFHRIPPVGNLKIDGYFQSERYFAHISDEVRRWFSMPFAELNRPMRSGQVGLHIRRGDYVGNPNFDTVPMSYYDRAIAKFRELGYEKFFVASDDIPWCQRSLTHGVEYEFSTERRAIYDMWELSRCEHFIIPNSTFGWWAAWMCPNPEKIVMAPVHSRWFGPKVSLQTHDKVPQSWTQIAW
jgi:hypothetical protein